MDHDAHQSLCDRALMLHRVHINECTLNACHQGRKRCPSPAQCQGEHSPGIAGFIAITAAAIACAVVAVLYQMGPGT